MHYRLLVTFGKDKAKNSQEAREYANSELFNDSSFCGDGGRFSSPIADWFVIGGRWSGELSRQTWAKEVEEKISALEKETGLEVWGCFCRKGSNNEKLQAKLKVKVEKLYKKATPTKYRNSGLCYDRDTHKETGYADDAMLVDGVLYEALLKKYQGLDQSEDDELHFVDLDYDPVSAKDFIGKKWLVVVDFHN